MTAATRARLPWPAWMLNVITRRWPGGCAAAATSSTSRRTSLTGTEAMLCRTGRSRAACRADGTDRSGAEERVVRLASRQAPDEQRQLPRVVIAPHRRLAARHLPAARDVVPAIGPMVDGVEQQALVFR